MATPDDLEEFRSCQIGYGARNAPWHDLSRGAAHWINGPDRDADAIGLEPLLSGAKTEDEGLFCGPAPLLEGRPRQGGRRLTPRFD